MPSPFKKPFISPDYGGDCIDQIPDAIFDILAHGKGKKSLGKKISARFPKNEIKHVVFFLIDGLGFNQLNPKISRLPFFQKIKISGLLSPITSVFPSTTAAALTTVQTGLTPQEHGLLEWRVYYEEVGENIYTVPFTLASEDHKTDTLGDKGFQPDMLFNSETIYSQLGREGVKSFVYSPRIFSRTTYSSLTHAGAEASPYICFSDLAVNLRHNLKTAADRTYHFVYWDYLDSIAHLYGTESEQYATILKMIGDDFYDEIISRLPVERAEDTLIMISADHGLISYDDDKVVYLTDYPEIMELLDTTSKGKQMVPWGGSRDLFFKAKPGMKKEAKHRLEKVLKGIADVHDAERLADSGIFGLKKETKKWRQRLGDLVILPYERAGVWYEVKPGERKIMKSSHGGNSAEEMLVPFGVAKLADLMN